MISGVLPVVDDEIMAEYHRLTTDLGVRGLLIFSNIEGLPLDDDSMWPLYAAAAGDDVPIWIHPQHGHSYPWLKKDLLDRLFGWPFETTLAMSRDWPVEVLDTIPLTRPERSRPGAIARGQSGPHHAVVTTTQRHAGPAERDQPDRPRAATRGLHEG